MKTIKIYRPSQYVKEDDRTAPWLHLEVINMWDYDKSPICFDGTNPLYLEESTEMRVGQYSSVDIKEPSLAMLQEIKNMGYVLAKKFIL